MGHLIGRKSFPSGQKNLAGQRTQADTSFCCKRPCCSPPGRNVIWKKNYYLQLRAISKTEYRIQSLAWTRDAPFYGSANWAISVFTTFLVIKSRGSLFMTKKSSWTRFTSRSYENENEKSLGNTLTETLPTMSHHIYSIVSVPTLFPP